MAANSFKYTPWFRFLSRYGAVLLLCIVAGHQLWLRGQGINSWKGGGFGMYADYHAAHTKVFIKAKFPLIHTESQQPQEIVFDQMGSVSYLYSSRNIQRLKDEYIKAFGSNVYTVEIWTPIYNPDSGTFRVGLRHSE